MAAAGTPSSAYSTASLIDHACGMSVERFQGSTSAIAAARSPVFRKSVARTNSPSGNSLNASIRGGRFERRLVVSLLGFGTGDAESRGRVHRIELEGPAEQRDRQLRLPLGDAHFRERQVRADQAGLQANRFLEQAAALIEPLLLKSDGAEHGVGGAARLRIRQRELDLRLGLFEMALLHQVRRALQRLAAVGRGGAAREDVEPFCCRSAADGASAHGTATRSAHDRTRRQRTLAPLAARPFQLTARTRGLRQYRRSERGGDGTSIGLSASPTVLRRIDVPQSAYH